MITIKVITTAVTTAAVLSTLPMLAGALAALAQDKPDLRTYPPPDSYERQLQDDQRHSYDSQRNGPLPETVERERRERERAEERRAEEYRRDNRRDNRRGYGGYSGGGCGSYDC